MNIDKWSSNWIKKYNSVSWKIKSFFPVLRTRSRWWRFMSKKFASSKTITKMMICWSTKKRSVISNNKLICWWIARKPSTNSTIKLSKIKRTWSIGLQSMKAKLLCSRKPLPMKLKRKSKWNPKRQSKPIQTSCASPSGKNHSVH